MAALSSSFCEAQPFDFFLTEQQLQVQERTALVGCVAAVAPAFNHFVGKSVAVRTVGC